MDIGTRVKRKGLPPGHPARARVGTVISLESGIANNGRRKPAARVLWDDSPDAKPYPYLLVELVSV